MADDDKDTMSVWDCVSTAFVEICTTAFIVVFLTCLGWVIRFCQKFNEEFDKYKEMLQSNENQSDKKPNGTNIRLNQKQFSEQRK